MDDISETLLINDPQPEIQQLASSIESLEQQIEENQLDLENLSKESETLEIYKKSEQLSEDQKDYYDRLPELKEQIEKEIAQLSGEIDKEKALTKLLEKSIEDKKYPFGDATI